MWIRDYRRKYGLNREGLGRLAKCSGELIYILECGGITHPGIADRIASVCGAGKNERNSIIDEAHWGRSYRQIPKYRARGERAEKAYRLRLAREQKEKELAGQMRAQAGQPTGREAAGRLAASTSAVPPRSCDAPTGVGQPTPIVAIDRHGHIVSRYDDCAAASREYGMRESSIRGRCEHRVKKADEFAIHGVTFRFAAEWDELDEDERLERAIIAGRQASKANREKNRSRIREPIQKEYSWQGQTHSFSDWAKIAGMHPQTLYSRLQNGMSIAEALTKPVQSRDR